MSFFIGPCLCRYNPIKTIKTSFIGTMNMLGLAKRCRARFLISSTSEVYGDPLQHPQVGTVVCGSWQKGCCSCWVLTRHLVAVCSQARLNMVCLHRPPYLNLPMQTEEYWGNVNPIGERSCYDEGKRAAECLTMDYHREHGQEVGAWVLASCLVCVLLDTGMHATKCLLPQRARSGGGDPMQHYVQPAAGPRRQPCRLCLPSPVLPRPPHPMGSSPLF